MNSPNENTVKIKSNCFSSPLSSSLSSPSSSSSSSAAAAAATASSPCRR
ncbi:unnamed protein product [Trichobilharzia regenti]|nr:unnamed protein product [Trichobilharzia regenti]